MTGIFTIVRICDIQTIRMLYFLLEMFSDIALNMLECVCAYERVCVRACVRTSVSAMSFSVLI